MRSEGARAAESKGGRSGPGNLPRRFFLVASGLVASGLFLWIQGSLHLEGQEPVAEKTPVLGPPPLCGEWHRGSGSASELDLGAVDRAYRTLKADLEHALGREREGKPFQMSEFSGGGLPACRSEGDRHVTIDAALGRRYRGKTLVFLSATPTEDPGRLRLPPGTPEDPEAMILVVGLLDPANLSALERRWKRPVHLAAEGFAKALGVRCASTWVRIVGEGEALELHESR